MADKAAIDNVVFDMGGVLMDFDTHLFSHLFVSNDDDVLLAMMTMRRSSKKRCMPTHLGPC